MSITRQQPIAKARYNYDTQNAIHIAKLLSKILKNKVLSFCLYSCICDSGLNARRNISLWNVKKIAKLFLILYEIFRRPENFVTFYGHYSGQRFLLYISMLTNFVTIRRRRAWADARSMSSSLLDLCLTPLLVADAGVAFLSLTPLCWLSSFCRLANFFICTENGVFSNSFQTSLGNIDTEGFKK